MSTVIDRYVTAVGARLPQSIRNDVEQELRATISDMVETEFAHLGAEEAAVKAVETLGDPAKLARAYRPRPRYLIGPDLFDDYVRLLGLVLAIVVPIVFVVNLVSRLFAEGGFAPADFAVSVSSAIQAAIGVCFVLTLIFAVLEWQGVRTGRGRTHPWTVQDLPEEPSPRRVSVADAAVPVTFTLATIAILVVQHFLSTFSDQTGPIPFLDPGLWNGWLPAIIVLLVAGAVIDILLYVRGGYTLGLTLASTAQAIAFGAVGAAMLATQRLVNPAWLEAYGSETLLPEPLDVLSAQNTLLPILLVIVGWSIIEAWVKYFKHRSLATSSS